MAIKTGHIVQNVGEMSIQFAHPLINFGTALGEAVHLGGFRLNGEILAIDQIVENSTLVPILGGGSVQLTNANRSCRMTANTIRTTLLNANGSVPQIIESGDNISYDFVTVADAIREIDGGDGVGGTFKIMATFSGVIYELYLLKCTLVSSQIFKISGNDVPTYQTIFNIGKTAIKSNTDSASVIADDLAEEYGTTTNTNIVTETE